MKKELRRLPALFLCVLPAKPGGAVSFPGMGTHNLLLALGTSVYLEVIAADPRAAVPTRPRWFGLDHVLPFSPPRLAAWVASTDDIAGSAVPELGEVEAMRRENHVWQMTVRPDGNPPLDGAAPLLIQRAPGVNPVAALAPSGLQLHRLRIGHPDPIRVHAMFARIGLSLQPHITVVQAGVSSLVAEIRTPLGLRQLGEDQQARRGMR